jgi:hypothetical protein
VSEQAPEAPTPAESLAIEAQAVTDQAATLRRIEATLDRLARAIVDYVGQARHD